LHVLIASCADDARRGVDALQHRAQSHVVRAERHDALLLSYVDELKTSPCAADAAGTHFDFVAPSSASRIDSCMQVIASVARDTQHARCARHGVPASRRLRGASLRLARTRCTCPPCAHSRAPAKNFRRLR
jgi:hypothetical protein